MEHFYVHILCNLYPDSFFTPLQTLKDILSNENILFNIFSKKIVLDKCVIYPKYI